MPINRGTLVIFFFVTINSFFSILDAVADVPRHFAFQGLIVDANGTPVNFSRDLLIRIFDAQSGGNLLFQEEHDNVNLNNGVYSIQVGKGDIPFTNDPSGGLPAAVVSADPPEAWIEVEVDDNDNPVFSRVNIGSVLFALKSTFSESLVKPNTSEIALSVDADGRVGIGTTDPQEELELRNLEGNNTEIRIINTSSASTAAARLRLTNDLGQDSSAGLFLHSSTRGGGKGNALRLAHNDDTADILFYFNEDDSMVLHENGRVSIGVDVIPNALLTVDGTASKPGGGSWLGFSDERLKSIEGSFDSGLDEIMKLNPVRYSYSKNNPLKLPHEGEYIGLSAQEVQDVVPEAVTEGTDGYLMLNNDPLMWTMLNAIKEQQQQIQQQQQKVEELEEKLEKWQ